MEAAKGQPTNIREFVANRVRELRTARGLSQEQLAAELGVATNTVSRWETATYRPKVEDLDRLARFFKASVGDFFPPEPASDEQQVLLRLMRSAKGLDARDLVELERFVDVFKARHRLQARPTGRPRRV